MNVERAPAVALLVVGILSLVKSVAAVAAPEGFKRFAGGWVALTRRVNTLVGVCCILLAAALWVCVLLGQSIVSWIVVVLGGCCLYAASVYFRRESFEKAAQVLVLNRSPRTVRIWGVLGGLLGLAFVWMAIRGL